MSTYFDTILAARENLAVYRGDSLGFTAYFYEDAEETIPYSDLSTWDTLELTVRLNKESVQAILVLDLAEGLSVTDNALTVRLTPEQMDLLQPQYYFDVQGKKADGTVGTVWSGLIANENDVTK